jgi:hypothetical protein
LVLAVSQIQADKDAARKAKADAKAAEKASAKEAKAAEKAAAKEAKQAAKGGKKVSSCTRGYTGHASAPAASKVHSYTVLEEVALLMHHAAAGSCLGTAHVCCLYLASSIRYTVRPC